MAQEVGVYLILHQPRRLRLPARPIPVGSSPREMADALFDERLNESYFRKVSRTAYEPALRLWQHLAAEGMAVGIGLSLSFLMQADRYAPSVVKRLQELLALPNVELIGVEPYHSFLPLVDIMEFRRRMMGMASYLARRFGQRIRVTDTTEMMMGNDIYHALASLGFTAALCDGRAEMLGGMPATRLYQGGGAMRLLPRHRQLSDDVGFRFTDRTWSAYPLFTPTYADWIAGCDGDFVLLGWDFETFGEHHRSESGIWQFLERLPRELRRRGVALRTPSEIVGAHAKRAEPLTLPIIPGTWAGDGCIDFFLGNEAQKTVFRLMHHAYSKALLTGRRELVAIARWLLQSDHLHLIQWYGRSGPEAEVSAYFTPSEWWPLGAEGIIAEVVRAYTAFVRALDPFVPERHAEPRLQRRLVGRGVRYAQGPSIG